MLHRAKILPVFAMMMVTSFLVAEEAEQDGALVFKKLGCPSCHASHRGGTPRGPSLRKAASHWNEKTLTAYLKDTAAAREKDERIRNLSNRYVPTRMLQYDFTENDLKSLVRFLIEKSIPKEGKQ